MNLFYKGVYKYADWPMRPSALLKLSFYIKWSHLQIEDNQEDKIISSLWMYYLDNSYIYIQGFCCMTSSWGLAASTKIITPTFKISLNSVQNVI